MKQHLSTSMQPYANDTQLHACKPIPAIAHSAACTRMRSAVSPASFASWPHLPVARDHAHHSRSAVPVTAPQFALPHPSPRRIPPRIPLPATSTPLHANQPRARIAAAPSSTAPREAAHARLHPHPRPIKGDAEFSSPPRHPVLAKPSRSTS